MGIKKKLSDVVPSYSQSIPGLVYVIEKVLEYISLETGGQVAPAKAEAIIKLGKGRTEPARVIKRRLRRMV